MALTNVTQYNRRIGLFEFLNQIPQYALDCWEIYRYARICAVDVKLIAVGEMTSASTNYAFEAGMARLPYDEAAAISPQELRTVRGGKYALAAQAGANRLVLNGFYGSFDELGNPVYERRYWQTLLEASSPISSDPDIPVIAVAVRSTLGNNVNVSINLSVTYHMQFFDLEIPPLPAQSSEIEGNHMSNKGVPSNAQFPKRGPGLLPDAERAARRDRSQLDSLADFEDMSEKQAPRRR